MIQQLYFALKIKCFNILFKKPKFCMQPKPILKLMQKIYNSELSWVWQLQTNNLMGPLKPEKQ